METFSGRAFIAGALLAFAAGCSGNPSLGDRFNPAAPLLRQATASVRAMPGVRIGWPKAKNQPILFAADGPNGVLMFNPNQPSGSPEGAITAGISGAAGMAVDRKCTLYVANISANTVTIYPRGDTTPKTTISHGLSWPYGIALDSHGNLFVSNVYADTLTAYHRGQTTPYETLSFGNYGQVMGVGIDSKDNVWVVSDYGPPYIVFEIPAGTTQINNAGLQDLNLPLGIAFGQHDEMYVSNLESSTINVYKYGTTTPYRTITNGIEHYGATLNAVTASDQYFQANQRDNVVGYKKGQSTPFSTLNLTQPVEPLGLAAWPLVRK